MLTDVNLTKDGKFTPWKHPGEGNIHFGRLLVNYNDVMISGGSATGKTTCASSLISSLDENF